MMRPVLLLLVMVWAAPSLAADCQSSVGDWKLRKGDVASVTIRPANKNPGRYEVHYTFSNAKNLRAESEKYLNKNMPIRFGSFAMDPIVHSVLMNPTGILTSPSEAEATAIKQALGNCI